MDIVEHLPCEGSCSNLVNFIKLSKQKRDDACEPPKKTLGNDLEPSAGIEFDSHEAAYSFYQEYARSMGFTTSIKNSRRSKKSKEFIDAKFACSRYGVTPESEGGTSRRSSLKKTDCKASMHVKRRHDDKWIIHDFTKEHNHELLPALAYHFRIHRNVKLAEKNSIDILHAVSERTRRMYAEMMRQSGRQNHVDSVQTDGYNQFEKGRSLGLDEGDAQMLFEYFKCVKNESPNFFYAAELNEDHRLRNVLWVDEKSRNDYSSFNDVVFLETFYVKNHEKLPFAPFIGVNHHCQPILLGCGLVSDETKSTYTWLLRTWVKAVGGKAPKVIITDVDSSLKASVQEAVPNARHCYALWHVFDKLPSVAMKRHEKLLSKFRKCVFKSLSDEEFDMRWWKMVTRFELQHDMWIQTLYDDRRMWAPPFVETAFFAGLNGPLRSESLDSFFDKYVHRKITLKEFIKQYRAMLHNRYEEESMADFDTLHKQPALKSPSPWEKQLSNVYTHAVFKKFQVEVLGVVGCHPKKESDGNSGIGATFRVQDCEKDDHFVVSWDPINFRVSCLCHLFEYAGILCRHALIVLQICGVSTIPDHYIVNRWTKNAKNSQPEAEASQIQSRAQRYNALCKAALHLSERGCSSQQAYDAACRTLVDTLKSCVDVNNAGNIFSEEEAPQFSSAKSVKKKNSVRKRKAHPEPEADGVLREIRDNLQDNLSGEGMSMHQSNVQGLLNLMDDGYFVGQTGLGTHDAFFTSQGLGHFDFLQPTAFSNSLQDGPYKN